MGVGSNTQRLAALQSVHCLGCGSVYAKPKEGGTLTRNPGCPDCGYVGWLPVTGRRGASRRGRSAADPRQPLLSTTG
jgi:predicted  nucleic acid-binding Zn-ribbon protein